MRLNTSPPGVIPTAIKPISGSINHLQKQEKENPLFFAATYLQQSGLSSGSVDLGRGARCFSSLGVWRPNFGSTVKNSVCEELQVKYDRACAYSGSWARWQSGCVERVLCSSASTGSAPHARSYHDIHWGSIWQPRVFFIYIYIVCGYMFYMPVLSVIGQTFTLRLYEALGKQGLGLEIT